MSVKLAKSEARAVTVGTWRGLKSSKVQWCETAFHCKLVDLELRIFKGMAFQIGEAAQIKAWWRTDVQSEGLANYLQIHMYSHTHVQVCQTTC